MADRKVVLSTERFSDRVEAYEKYRPHYPSSLFHHMQRVTGLGPDAVIADIGSGTGISTGPLLEIFGTVYAVEPNAAMRQVAERHFSKKPGFHSSSGTAEQTGIPNTSIDMVLAAQAFHWFEPQATSQEWRRILKPPGWTALVWNERLEVGTTFLKDYEALLQEFGTDYLTVKHQNLKSTGVFSQFFGKKGFEKTSFENIQRLDYDGVQGRLLSSSYVPGVGHPRHQPMLTALKALFDRTAENGLIDMIYQTECYLGRLVN